MLRAYMGQNVQTVSKAINPDSPEILKLFQSTNDALLFKNMNGSESIGNLFSTRDAISKALNIEKTELMSCLDKASSKPTPTKLSKSPKFKHKYMVPNLLSLPIPKFFPKDGGRYITAGIIVAEWDGKRNASFHRMMILNKKEMVIRLVPRHLHLMYEEAKKAGKELKIAVCIGMPIEVMLSAAMSLDYGVDELEVASSLHQMSTGEPLEVGITDSGIVVPSDAEYVFEGHFTFKEHLEGPFVDSTKTYDSVRLQPVISIDKIWTAENPIFHIIFPGGLEHGMIQGIPKELSILKSVRSTIPQTHAVRLTEGGCCWMHAVVSITKNCEGDGKNAIMAAFTGHTPLKMVTIVDEDIDIFDNEDVEWAVATRFQGSDFVIVPNATGSSLDPSIDDDTTWKVGIDATIPLNRDRAIYKKAIHQDT